MLIEDIISHLDEGPHDPSIFKAVFTAGGPGSGKSYVVDKTALQAMGFKVVNNDNAFERFLAQAGLKPTPDNIFSRQGQEIRGHAKTLTNKQMQGYLGGNLGLVIDGTGKDFDKIKRQSEKLRSMGYDTAMIFVNTSIKTALMRNRKRSRSLPDEQVEKMWSSVQSNIGKFAHYFGNDMHIIDNNDDSDFDTQVLQTYRTLGQWAKETPNPR